MLKPLELRVDREVDAGYVRYRALPPGEHVARCARVSEDVVVDYNGAGEILGIELLAFDPEALSVAQHFADANGLMFPDLAAA